MIPLSIDVISPGCAKKNHNSSEVLCGFLNVIETGGHCTRAEASEKD